MRAHRFAIATAASNFVLLVTGGLVRPAGSSRAWPEWPSAEPSALLAPEASP